MIKYYHGLVGDGKPPPLFRARLGARPEAGMLHPPCVGFSARDFPPGGGARRGDIEKEEFDGDCNAEGVGADAV